MGKKKHKTPAEEPAVESRSEFGPLLESIAAALLLVQVVLRLLISDVEAGNDFLLAGLVWLAAGVYFTARGLGGDGTFRFSGLELPMVFFCILGLLAAGEAPYGFGAQRIVVTWVSNVLLCVTLVDWMHRRGTARVWTAVSATAFVLLIYGVLQNVAILPSLVKNELAGAGERMQAYGRSGQPFGSMVSSNTFAGFIAVILPMAIGSILDARTLAGRRPFWMSPNAVLRGMFVVLAIVVLAMTESRGGSIAAGAGLAALVVLLWTRGRGWSRRKLAFGAAGAVLAAAIGLSAGGMNALKRSETFRLRADAYWPAAVRMVEEAPWRGHGLGSYEDHYPRLKPDLQTYTRSAHNDYLQIAAEIGVPGAAMFALIWIVALWRGIAGGPREPPKQRPAPARGAVAALAALAALGVAAFAVEYGLSGLFADNLDAGPAVALALLVCWLVYAAFTFGADAAMDSAAGPGFGLGALAGVVAYLVHATVDFDFTSSVFSQFLFVALAIGVVRTAKLGYLPMPRPAGVFMALACFAFGIFMVGFFAPDVQLADSKRRAAEEEIKKATRLAADDPKVGVALDAAKRLLWRRAYDKAEVEAHEDRPGAFELNDRDARTLMLIAQVYWFEYASDIAKVKTPDDARRVEQAGLYDAANEALASMLQGPQSVRATSYSGWFFGGVMHLRRYDHFTRVVAMERREFEGMANTELVYAAQYFDEALRLYPTLAAHHAWIARVRDLQGDRRKAREHAGEAKRLHEMTGAEPELKLTAEELGWVEAALQDRSQGDGLPR